MWLWEGAAPAEGNPGAGENGLSSNLTVQPSHRKQYQSVKIIIDDGLASLYIKKKFPGFLEE